MTAVLTAAGQAPAAAASGRERRWDRIGLATLLVLAAGLYLWDLSASGWANSFYSAAAQAGSVSWKAFFFGSSDAANSITVDKPPASLWLMGLSVRMFGLNSWALLVPQALLGVASVAMLWAVVRRYFGAVAGLLAGLVLALTPVAVLMFRFNNPDALLVFLMIAAVWAVLRGTESGRTGWLVAAGALVGLGFLTKQLQVMLVVPALASTYLLAGPRRLLARMWQLLAALVAMIVSAGWWLLVVEVWPAGSRPWIGGSQNNSILELTLGYNGLGRLSGNEVGSVVPGGFGAFGGGSMWGTPGIGRLFEPEQGGQIAWLIPAALLLLLLGLLLRRRAPRTDLARAALLVWGLWLVVTGLVFSYMAGIFHAYYTVALAPAVAASVGAGTVLAWRHRDRLWVRLWLAVTLAMTAEMAWILLARSPSFVPWLRWVVVVGGVAGVLALVAAGRRVAVVAGALTLLVGLAGPTAYALETVATPHHGSIVSAGPNVEHGFGPGGGPGIAGQRHRPPWMTGMPGGGEFRGPGKFGGPGGGLLDGSTPGPALVALLSHDADHYTWVAATVGANVASGYQLATQQPVMPIGGFNGTDPSPTLAQFQRDVAAGRIHYFIGAGAGPMMAQGGESSAIRSWVADHFDSTVVDGVTLYDLTSPKTVR
ncbi:glycosyltransferase family 39 protein [Skermania sp. ID1734]|uniref:glycosyltransferase family 39 protein n=1 Tax=Skermania sp. ID1734 TaxID=2597516 RepID=UPI00117F998F|nr:glycosyltransferase family 39 protein [Skermania sp. ID1734]TSD96525.1 glycosyltransferase family 39 protein [Skermania sp. ID1734]